MDDFVISNSGVKVWKTPESHPLLKHTDTTHPAFKDKMSETYSRGLVKRLPRICSVNSEDARTWHYFSPLLSDTQRKVQEITCLLRQAFPESLNDQAMEAVSGTELEFWKKINSPPSRPTREGPSEPDILIAIRKQTIVLVEAKYLSDVSEKTTYEKARNQVIRLIDVGSYYAKQNGYESSYVIVLQYGDAKTNAKGIVNRYAKKPEAIQQALPYRTDLAVADYQRLSNSVAFVRWPDPIEGLI